MADQISSFDEAYSQLIQMTEQNPESTEDDLLDVSADHAEPEALCPMLDSEPVPGFGDDGAVDFALKQLRLTLMGQFRQFRAEAKQACEADATALITRQRTEMESAKQTIQQLKELAAKLQLCYDRAECRDQHRVSTMTVLAAKWHNARTVSSKFHHWLLASRKRRRVLFMEVAYAIPNHGRTVKKRSMNRWRASLLRTQKIKREELFRSQLDLVSRKLVTTYEANLQSLRTELAEAKRQIAFLVQNKQKMETEMKQAFLRSVSALNLEAMSMFNSKLGEDDPLSKQSAGVASRCEVPEPSPGSSNTLDLA